MDSISHFAGTASLSSTTASTPSPHTLWCADTGATSRMTPHRHWLRDYTPHRVPVRLPNNSVVYSAGICSVLFVPEIEGRKLRSVQFTNVLHVPDLQNNLLSVLYLTQYKQFSVVILETVMNFLRSGSVLFSASVNTSNCAYLEGSTIPIPPTATNSALASSTLPLDTSLWHRRLCHHHYGGIDRILKQPLVSSTVLS